MPRHRFAGRAENRRYRGLEERADHQGGLDGILAKAITGINAMPPKGTCADCSDEELKGAIKKMSGL